MPTRRSFLAALLAGATHGALAQSPVGTQGDPAKFGSRIRVGQIGTQHSHAAGKMEAVRSLPDLYEVAGFTGSAKADSPPYAGLRRFTEEAELLSQKDLKAVLIETSVEEACGAALRALRANMHVHLDKPGSLEHAPFKAMRLEAAQRKLTVQMGYMLRYNPAFELLFKAKQEGWLGEILEIDAMMGKLADPLTRKAIGSLPGGGMFELACHTIDAVVTLLGKPAEVHPFSTPTQPGDQVQDNQLAVLVYPKATVTIRCNHADPFGGPRRRFQVAGTKGSMEILPLESGKASLWLDQPRGEWRKGANTVELPVPKGRYTREFVDLASIIRGEKPLAWSALHDIAVHETVLRAAGVPV